MPRWTKNTLGSLLLPGGILSFSAAVLANTGWPTLTPPALVFLDYCAVIGGLLLAWRFSSSRVFLAVVVIFLARQAVGIFIHELSPGFLGWIGLQSVAVLVPLDFLLIAVMHERGLTVSSIAPVGVFLFVQAVILAVLSQSSSGVRASHSHHLPAVISLPDHASFAFFLIGTILLLSSLLRRKPADYALFWSLVAFFFSLRYAGNARASALYSLSAAVILATAVVENSYLLAYHDELTSLPSRRAFNDALLRLPETYCIAVVDIDHFKRFNDTYGHDIGDQVLRLVATNLSHVTGGGEAYRCGGEEFMILFPGKGTEEVVDHLQQLRRSVEASEFRLRGEDRRHVPRGPDRRNQQTSSRSRKGQAIRKLASSQAKAPSSVTVSMGVASSARGADPEEILRAADQALYRAKANGRNRVEVAATRRDTKARAAGIA